MEFCAVASTQRHYWYWDTSTALSWFGSNWVGLVVKSWLMSTTAQPVFLSMKVRLWGTNFDKWTVEMWSHGMPTGNENAHLELTETRTNQILPLYHNSRRANEHRQRNRIGSIKQCLSDQSRGFLGIQFGWKNASHYLPSSALHKMLRAPTWWTTRSISPPSSRQNYLVAMATSLEI